MPSLFQIKSFLRHWLLRVDEHSIHSPFFFDLYEKVIRNKQGIPDFRDIEAVRQKLLASTTEIEVVDLGAPSHYFTGSKRPLSQVAATSASPVNHARLLYRLATYLQATLLVELGTSVGMTTLYLSRVPNARVITFEGNPQLIDVAKTHVELFQATNIQIVEGQLDETLHRFLQQPAKIHLALLDANHRYEPTVRYFNLLMKRMTEKGVVVIDDIYRSEEMARAWQELKSHELVYGSVDLFTCGILFLDPALNRQHYIWAV